MIQVSPLGGARAGCEAGQTRHKVCSAYSDTWLLLRRGPGHLHACLSFLTALLPTFAAYLPRNHETFLCPSTI